MANHPARIALVRHGETQWNATAKFQGISDIPLNDTGLAQANEVVDFLRAHGPWDELRTSPLQRAAKTGEIIADALGVQERRLEPLLAERDWGGGEGLTLPQIRDTFAQLRDIPDSEVRAHIPFVEPIEMVVARGRHVLTKLAGTRPGKRVLCALHGTILRAAVNDLLVDDIGYVPNVGVVILDAWLDDGLRAEVVAKSFEGALHPWDPTQSGASAAAPNANAAASTGQQAVNPESVEG